MKNLEILFNNELLNLEILAEECAEVQQIKSKIIRFGIDDYHPKNKMVNRKKLENELGHLLYLVDILIAQGTVSIGGIEAGKNHKKEKLMRWYKSKDSNPALIEEDLEVILKDSDPAIIECNYCDSFVDRDIYNNCPVCGNEI